MSSPTNLSLPLPGLANMTISLMSVTVAGLDSVDTSELLALASFQDQTVSTVFALGQLNLTVRAAVEIDALDMVRSDAR
jgi:hypothetical protein